MLKQLEMALRESADQVKSLRMDGIPNMIRSKYVLLSVFWFVAFLGCLFVCIWLLIGTFSQFLAYKVTTTIRNYDETQSIFPTVNSSIPSYKSRVILVIYFKFNFNLTKNKVTFCNMNPFTSDYAVDLLNQSKQLVYVQSSASGSIEDNYNVFVKIQAYMNQTTGKLLSDDEKSQLSSLDNMLIT